MCGQMSVWPLLNLQNGADPAILDQLLLEVIQAQAEWYAALVAQDGFHRLLEENIAFAANLSNAMTSLATGAIMWGSMKPGPPVQPKPPKPKGPPSEQRIPKVDIDSLPPNVQNAFHKYNKAGWKGNVSGQTPGTGAGGKWKNKNGTLPKTDARGNSIDYREFDVNNKAPDAGRDAQRFVVGSDGTVYYTGNHYKSFVEIIN